MPHGQLGVAVQLLGQLAADVLDGAADGVLAVQRALRAAQHLDAADVEHVQQRALRSGDVDIVQVDAHAWIHAPQRIGLTHAADVHGRGAGGTACGIDGQVGHLRIEIADVLDVELVQRLRGEGGHRHRYFLQGLLALARGDGDRIERGGLGALARLARFGLLGPGAAGRRHQQAGDRQAQVLALHGHSPPPRVRPRGGIAASWAQL
ncbi:hypothetical protein QE438_000727 [Pseudoxanthomonas sp. SORGH_AS 997]|nr:hypothetical protein [Pseudoxanthomonas sp. SORGH_AS_0997]